MELTKEYLAEQEDCIKRNFDGYNRHIDKEATKERYEIINSFISDAKIILSVGSGGHEPVVIKATHASDVHAVAEELLRKQGWKGMFMLASCDNLPFASQMFDVAVCSEVIEHLPDIKSARSTILELQRVAKRWIVTTPCNPLGPKNTEPTHKRAFDNYDLLYICEGIDVQIERRGLFWYVTKK